MANRHLSRSIVLQTLFEVDFRESISNAPEIMERDVLEFAPGVVDHSFMSNLLDLILSKKEDIDKIIVKAAPDWPLDKISIVDRNILRLGLAELIFGKRDEVPAKVAINESIELAKTFGGESSGKFINGVLGAVYKEMGEPGKDQQPKKRVEVKYEDLPVEKKAGALIFSEHKDTIYIALVHDVFGHWTLSKGGVEDDEDSKIGLIRIIKDKLGLDIEILDHIGENEYVANHPEQGRHRKRVDYYLTKSKYIDINLAETGGIDDAKWFKLADILELNFYDDILPLITEAVKKIVEITSEKKSKK